MKNLISTIAIVGSFSFNAFAGGLSEVVTDIADVAKGLPPVAKMSEQGVGTWRTMETNYENAINAGLHGRTYSLYPANRAVLSSVDGGRTAVINSIDASADGTVTRFSAQLPKTDNNPAEFKLVNSLQNNGQSQFTFSRKFETPVGPIDTEYQYALTHTPGNATASSLRSQLKFRVSTSSFEGALTMVKRHGNEDFVSFFSNQVGHDKPILTEFSAEFPEGKVEALKMDISGKSTLYTTSYSKTGSTTVYARTVKVTPIKNSDSPIVEIGEPRKISPQEVFDLGLFTAKTESIAGRSIAQKPVANLIVNDGDAAPAQSQAR